LNLKLLHIALGNTQLKEVAQGVAVNVIICEAGILTNCQPGRCCWEWS